MTLSSDRQLEAHLWCSVAQSGAEAQPVFRSNRDYHTRARDLGPARRPARRPDLLRPPGPHGAAGGPNARHPRPDLALHPRRRRAAVGDTRGRKETRKAEKAAEETQEATETAAKSAQKSTEIAAKDAQKNTETATFPIEGYDEMNVGEVSERLNGLSVDELKRVRKYEKDNKDRGTLRKEMKQKIETTS